MRITLFLEGKLVNFKLPSEKSGSFSFDENDSEEFKLINIEARNNEWYLYSTSKSYIMFNNGMAKEALLKEDNFYILRRANKNYLIYVRNLFDETIKKYLYNDDISIKFGNSGECNIKYNCPYLNTIAFTIEKNNGYYVLTKDKNMHVLYINNKAVINDTQILNFGDRIDAFGFTMVFLKNMLLINNINNLVIFEEPAKISKFVPRDGEQLLNDGIENIDLYKEGSYFLKSPRIRNFIETKDIKIDTPPNTEQGKEASIILTIIPMLGMGAYSVTSIMNIVSGIKSGTTTLEKEKMKLITSGISLFTMLIWPIISKIITNIKKKRQLKKIKQKYGVYLKKKEKELEEESTRQREILFENLISPSECITTINNRENLFWNKRNDESDFLCVRVGTGDSPLNVNIKAPSEDFSIEENELVKEIENLTKKYKYMKDVPIGYSLYENSATAIMGEYNTCADFANSIILQLITFYSYDDLKIVLFTNNDNISRWRYIKYLPHNFTNDKSFRFFAHDFDSIRNVSNALEKEINERLNASNGKEGIKFKPHYLIIIDDYDSVKKENFVKQVTESNININISILFLENNLSKLPSKCNNFISLAGDTAGILKNSYESQEIITFKKESADNIDMFQVAKVLSNIPIQFEEDLKSLPESISFLEMERVGKVEQLNILNRWNTSDSTTTLKSEVGVDDTGNLMYLDLHERFHGPHGLIAGMTGSGKSEFIITYILSMAVNYSPDYVSFILIDYKGGGLAGAFENKTNGIRLPHLAGTITNLDKAEMDRTLVSIDSEIKRRQIIFNETRDKLGESTIDIYKYQKFYMDKKVDVPVPHLFIISDEFAELKSQQPEFMDNLISVARIGRSLGVHLILATQKPSGVVNDQIWSNSKFRVCLKVQDASDSKEMLKREDAASLKQTGRFYLQVGYDEYFALGQSAWCGAKYFPSEKIAQKIDKNVDFINSCGLVFRSRQLEEDIKVESKGEQVQFIINNIIEVAKMQNKYASQLWLENIPPIILVDNLISKYQFQKVPFNVEAIIGEYDAPERQMQGLVKYNYLKDGNSIIYGSDGSEREMLLNTMIYSTVANYSAEEINFYMIDFGSQSLKRFSKFPHVGGIVLSDEVEKYTNLIKLLTEELAKRKNILSEYNGEYSDYIAAGNKMPVIVTIFNNFDNIVEGVQDLSETFPNLVRDSERCGVIFILSANSARSVSMKISQNFKKIFALRLNDSTDYSAVFNSRKKIEPRSINGRGLVFVEDLYEFQTASLVEDINNLNAFLDEKVKAIDPNTSGVVLKIPTLPEVVSYDIIQGEVDKLNNLPIGISKAELNVVKYDFMQYFGTVITASKLANTDNFVLSLSALIKKVADTDLVFIDGNKKMSSISSITNGYYNDDFVSLNDKLIAYNDELVANKSNRQQVFIIYAFDKYYDLLGDGKLFENLITSLKKNEFARMIIVDDGNKIKKHAFENWYSSGFSKNDGIWIGKGFADQVVFSGGTYRQNSDASIDNNMGVVVVDSINIITKYINFVENGDSNEK